MKNGTFRYGALNCRMSIDADELRPRPFVEARQPEQQRHERQRHEREVPRRRLEDAAPDEPPLPARHVLQHQERERSHRQPEAEEDPDEPGPEELVGRRRPRRSPRPPAPRIRRQAPSAAVAPGPGTSVFTACVSILNASRARAAPPPGWAAAPSSGRRPRRRTPPRAGSVAARGGTRQSPTGRGARSAPCSPASRRTRS